MPKQDEIDFYLETIKNLQNELFRCETLNDRKIVRDDIYKYKQKVNELVKQLDENIMFTDFSN